MLYSNRAQWFFLVTFFSVWILEASPQYRRPRIVVVLAVLGGIVAWRLYRQTRARAVLTPPALVTPDAQHHNDALNAEYATRCAIVMAASIAPALRASSDRRSVSSDRQGRGGSKDPPSSTPYLLDVVAGGAGG